MKWNAGIEQGTVRKSEEKRGKERRRERGKGKGKKGREGRGDRRLWKRR